jgi:hypothetical protein
LLDWDESFGKIITGEQFHPVRRRGAADAPLGPLASRQMI